MSIIKHSFLYLIARGIPALVNLLAIAVFTRILYPDEYGQYVLVVSTAALANSVLFQWIKLGLLRFMAVYQQQRKLFLSTVLTGFLAIVCVSALITSILIFLFRDPGMTKLLLFGMVLLWLEALFELNQELVRSELSPRSYGVYALLRTVLMLFVGGTLGYLGFGAFGMLSGALVSFALPVVYQLRTNFKDGYSFTFDPKIIRQLTSYGLPLTATFALGYILSSSDRLLLGWLLGAKAAGLYAIGYDLARQGIGVLLSIINLAAYPLIVNAIENEGIEAGRTVLSQSLVLILVAVFPATAGLCLLAPNICHVLVGSEFRETASQLIPWVAVGSMLAGIKAFYFDLSFQLGRQTTGQIGVVFTAALVNLLLNLWWIPKFGLIGAAYATTVAYGVALIMSWRIGRSIMSLPFSIPSTAKIVVATTGMSLCVYPLRHWRGGPELATQIALGIVVFLVLIWVVDLEHLRSNWRARAGTVKILIFGRKGVA